MNINNKKASSFFLFDAVIAAAIFFMTMSIIMYSLNTNHEIETNIKLAIEKIKEACKKL